MEIFIAICFIDNFQERYMRLNLPTLISNDLKDQ